MYEYFFGKSKKNKQYYRTLSIKKIAYYIKWSKKIIRNYDSKSFDNVLVDLGKIRASDGSVVDHPKLYLKEIVTYGRKYRINVLKKKLEKLCSIDIIKKRKQRMYNRKIQEKNLTYKISTYKKYKKLPEGIEKKIGEYVGFQKSPLKMQLINIEKRIKDLPPFIKYGRGRRWYMSDSKKYLSVPKSAKKPNKTEEARKIHHEKIKRLKKYDFKGTDEYLSKILDEFKGDEREAAIYLGRRLYLWLKKQRKNLKNKLILKKLHRLNSGKYKSTTKTNKIIESAGYIKQGKNTCRHLKKECEELM